MNRQFPRPKVIVSRCLGFDACRYDGQKLHSWVVDLLQEHVDWVDVCPELQAGLGVPRSPIRLCTVEDRVEVHQPAASRLVSNDLEKAVKELLPSLTECDGALLKAKSPSCGIRDAKVYRGIDKPQFHRWDSGVFAGRLLDQDLLMAVDDERRLSNLILRDHFLIKLFVCARFREMSAKPAMGALVDFHASHKLLLLAYNQSRFRICGKITANHDHLPPAEVYKLYSRELREILKKPFRRQAMVNTLYHAYGWISEHLSSDEKHYIINTIEEYRDERIPLQAVTRLIEAQAIRFDQQYLLSQILLRPFPPELSDLSDSGRGREVT